MTRSIYIASLEGHSGKSLVALGLVHALVRQVGTIGIFRPVIKSRTEEDHVVKLLLAHDGIDMTYDECVGVTYDEIHRHTETALATIVERYRAIEQACDAVVIIGSDYTDLASPTELTFNARVAANLGAPVLLVISGFERTASEIGQITNIATAEIEQSFAASIGVLVNRCDPDQISDVREWLRGLDIPGWALPETPLLSAPVVADLMVALQGELLLGDESLLSREAEDTLLCGMNAEHVLERLSDGQLCIVAGDRPEILITVAAAHASDGFPSLAGVALNGGYQPSELITDLVKGLGHSLPIFVTPYDSYDTARLIASTRGVLGRGTQRKAETAIQVFEQNIDSKSLLQVLDVPRSEVVTPLMFEA
ncbi:MAG: DRTGG domain-containing protein, partial [Aquihabitans sp.]